MAHLDVVGMTLYAQEVGPPHSDISLMENLRRALPTLMDTDPDDYRTTREFVFPSGRLVYVVALGQKRDKSLWYAVMAVGASVNPPPEYITVSKAVGTSALEKAFDEGDFDE
jgi:hypothetical protein